MKTLLRPALVLSFLLAAGCGKKPGREEVDFRHNRGAKAGTPVATFGGDSITLEELDQRFAEMSPYARARYQTLEQKKEYLDGLVRFELFAAEALRRGLANDPEVVETAKKVMVQQLLKKELDEKPTPISDEAIAAYYEKRKSDYVKPEMVRLAHVFLQGPKEDPAAREAAKKKADEVLAKARGLQPLDYQGFGQLVREHSEEPKTKPLDGDLRFLSVEELTAQYGAAVAEAAAKLTQVGAVHDSVVETDQGFHILKLQGRQASLNLSLEQVKPQIQNILVHEKKMENYQALLDSLKKSGRLEVDEEALGKVKVDPKAPAADTKGPTPGTLPAPAPGAQRR